MACPRGLSLGSGHHPFCDRERFLPRRSSPSLARHQCRHLVSRAIPTTRCSGRDQRTCATDPSAGGAIQEISASKAQNGKGVGTSEHRPFMSCPCCARRQLLLGSLALGGNLGAIPKEASSESLEVSGCSSAQAILAAKDSRPEWVDEIYTWLIGVSGDTYDDIIRDYKDQLLGRSLGLQIQEHQTSSSAPFQILELGVGTGKNFNYFAGPGIRVTGVDPSRAAEKYARPAAEAAGLREDRFTFLQGVGEGLPVPSSSVDAVVSTLVMCSVTDLKQTVAEISRVLKPGGTLYTIEHVAAPQGTSQRRVQELLDPLQQFVADGCHLTREPLPVIQGSGFNLVDARVVEIEGLSLLKWHLIGSATKTA